MPCIFNGTVLISKYEVTRGEFRRFVKATRYRTEAEQKGGKCGYGDSEESWKRPGPGFDQTDTHPVVCVSRRDAMAYAKWLSRETGRNYRVPTAVEWQYAARAGSDFALLVPRLGSGAGAMPCGDPARANLQEAAPIKCEDGVRFTAQVGSFPSSEIGLHDMIGNVLEWVSSCFIEGKGLPLQDENTGHCDTRQHVVASTGYDSLHGDFFSKYSNANPLQGVHRFSQSMPDVGFRLVKDFELKKKTGETGDVVE